MYYIANTLHSRKPVEPQAEKQKKAESSSQSALIILVYRVDLIFLRVWNYKKGCKKAGSKKHSAKHRVILTLESGIDVGQGINVGPGKLGKKNKRRALNTHVLCSE